jgi:hypothetical protein
MYLVLLGIDKISKSAQGEFAVVNSLLVCRDISTTLPLSLSARLLGAVSSITKRLALLFRPLNRFHTLLQVDALVVKYMTVFQNPWRGRTTAELIFKE